MLELIHYSLQQVLEYFILKCNNFIQKTKYDFFKMLVILNKIFHVFYQFMGNMTKKILLGGGNFQFIM